MPAMDAGSRSGPVRGAPAVCSARWLNRQDGLHGFPSLWTGEDLLQYGKGLDLGKAKPPAPPPAPKQHKVQPAAAVAPPPHTEMAGDPPRMKREQ